MLDRLVADFPSIWHGVVLAMAIILVILVLFVVVNLVIIPVRAFIKRRREDSLSIRQGALDSLVGQVSDLKRARLMIDKLLKDIGDNDDESNPTTKIQ